jgi:predicted RNA-binding Zn-ribbon protein involved in translation (DUF1610 family)
MATYCFKCRSCGAGFSLTVASVGEMTCPSCGRGEVVRDYRSENVGVQTVALKRERERGGTSAVRDLFLPTTKDFEGPGDPDGAKGIRNWAVEHGPREGNAKPLYPDIPKRSF